MSHRVIIIFVFILMAGIIVPCRAGRLWGDHGVLAATDMDPAYPSMCQLGELELAAAFPCFDEDGIYRAAVQGVTWDGELFFEDEPLLLSAPNKWMFDTNIIAVPDEEGGVFIVWQTRSEIPLEYDVYAQHLDQDLTPMWEDGGKLLYRTNTDIASTTRYHHYGIIPSDNGGLIVIDRQEFGEHASLYDHLFFVHLFDSNGDRVEDWPEAGVQLFDDPGNTQFYNDPGRGVWCFGRSGRGFGEILWINLVQTDGTFQFEETLLPEIPENSRTDEFYPDGDGGFYIAYYDFINDDWCRAGIQRYDNDGNPIWDSNNIWFTEIPRTHGRLTPIVSENGSRLFCFVENGQEPPTSLAYWIEPTEDGPNLLRNDPIMFDNSRVKPFFFMGEGDLLINVMRYEWNDEWEFWGIQSAEANIIAPNGAIVWDRGEVPIEPYGMAAHRDWETFFVATEIETPDRMSNLQVDCFNQWAESEWGEPTEVYDMPQFGSTSIAQLLPGGVIRLVGRTFIMPGPHEAAYNYQLINPDGSRQLPVTGRQFFELVEWAESASSNGSLIMVRYTGSPGHYTYSDVSVLDDRNELHPEQPLPIEDMMGDSEFREVVGDSIGGAFLLFRTGLDDDRRYDVVRVNRNCEWDGEVLRPFDFLVSGEPEILPDGNGGAWVASRNPDLEFILQRISPDNDLAWNEHRVLEWDARGTARPLRLAAGDTSFWALVRIQSEDLDSSNVIMMSYNQDGRPRWRNPVTAFEPNTGFQHENLYLNAIANQEGYVWILCWERFNAPPMYSEIRLQMMSPEGERMFDGRGLPLPLFNKGYQPGLINDDDGGVWLFMEVYDVDQPNLRSFHFNRSGELIDDRPEPDPNGTAVILPLVEGLSIGKYFPPWRYENGDVGIAFEYRESVRAQRISDTPDSVPSRPEPASPGLFDIVSIYPSPSNDRVTVEYRLERSQSIELSLVDMTGRRVGTLFKGERTSGTHRATIPTGSLASGIYAVELRASGEVQRKLLIEVK